MIPMPIYQSICLGRLSSLIGHEATPADFDFIKTATKIDASRAVAIWNEKRSDDFTPSSFPCCIAPWPVCWIEYKMGGECYINGKPEVFPVAKAATLCRCFDREEYGERFDNTFRQFSRSIYDKDKYSFDDARYCIASKPWGHRSNEAFMQPFTVYSLISVDGMEIARSYTVPNDFGLPQDALAMFAIIPLLTFSLANCKNIIAEKCSGYYRLPEDKKIKKKQYRYYVLKISGSMTGATEPKGGSAEKPMHICRGNFARYTDDKPLFGKYTGLFWRPMHVRGNVKNGVVYKDYALTSNLDKSPQ